MVLEKEKGDKKNKSEKSDVHAMSVFLTLSALGLIESSPLTLYESYPFICSHHPSLTFQTL